VTAFDVLSLFPFENRVSADELSGRRLRRVLREAGGAHLDWQSPERWHGQVAGVEFVYDHEADAVRSVRVDGDPLDPEATYEAATLATTVRPGGQFPSLDGEGTDAGHVHDALLARAKRAGLPAEPAGRIQRVGVDRPAGRSDEPPDG
jgi:2',3'-cyclic-nucleotide 2'-phosphodiesterase (5'-nucleotidase family)